MNIRDLRYLVAVAEHHHFGKAAEICFVSQPTLSGQIKKLEAELNLQLFERTNKKVDVTPAGEEVILHARKILELVDTIHELALSKSDPLAGSLRIGIIPTIAPYLIPLILRPLKDQYPQAELTLSEDITDHLNEQLENRHIDVAILATPVTHPEFEFIELYEEPFWLAHHRDDPLYGKDNITDADLSCMNLLLLDDGHCLTHQVMHVCSMSDRNDLKTTGDLRASSLETLLQLVAAGYGSTLVPALAVKGSWMTDMGIIARQIDSTSAKRRVSLVYRKSFSRKAVIEALTDLIPRYLPNTVNVL